jgi:carbon starvation protein CstA
VDGSTPYEKLLNAMVNPETGKASPAILVNAICHSWLGNIGAGLAVLGVVAAPITSGDTAFRSARLIAADFMHYKQNKIYKRLILSVPLFIVSGILLNINFDILWRYFAWFNQTLSVFTLWSVTIWLSLRQRRERRNIAEVLIGLVPALWMTLVCTTYILIAPEGFNLDHNLSYGIGAVTTASFLGAYILWHKRV